MVLCAPDGGLALDLDLHGGDVGDAFVECGLRTLLQGIVCEGEELLALGDGQQQIEHVHHGIVIQSDGLVVAAFDGVVLRPAAVGILSGKDVVEPLHQRGFDILALGGGEDACQKLELLGGGAVVKGAAVVPGISFLGGPVRAGLARAQGVIDRL